MSERSETERYLLDITSRLVVAHLSPLLPNLPTQADMEDIVFAAYRVACVTVGVVEAERDEE